MEMPSPKLFPSFICMFKIDLIVWKLLFIVSISSEKNSPCLK